MSFAVSDINIKLRNIKNNIMPILTTSDLSSTTSNNPEALRGVAKQYHQEQASKESVTNSHSYYTSIVPCLFVAITRHYSSDSVLASSLDSSLSPKDILFFLQIVSLYQSELSKGHDSIVYSSEKLAKLLGYDYGQKKDMRSIILRMVKKLEQAGLLKVTRSKNRVGADLINRIAPLLPDHIYQKIRYEKSQFNVDSSKLVGESNLQHILRTKLFVPISLEFMKSLFADSTVPSSHKLFFLNCIITALKNYRITGDLSFASTSSELMSKNSISRDTLTRICKYIKNQNPNYFIEVQHKYTASEDIDSNRYDQSIFVISISPIVIPNSFLKNNNEAEIIKSTTGIITNAAAETIIKAETKEELKVLSMNATNQFIDEEDEAKKTDTYAGFQTASLKMTPSILKIDALDNKEEIIKNKDIDYIDENYEDLKNASISRSIPTSTPEQNYKEESFENEQDSFSSESYNNSSFLNVSSKNTVLKKRRNQKANIAQSAYKEAIEKESEQKSKQEEQKEPAKTCLALDKARQLELRHFYPLAEKDVNLLNSRANREFSTNFVNQLLLKLYIKYPEKRFKNKFTFLSYMIKALKEEYHQGPLVNHTTFRFSCNIGTEETKLLEYEKYLNQIEHSFDTGKEMQVRKKIAGRFSSEVAYKILTKIQFKTNHDNSFILALIPNRLDSGRNHTECVSESQTSILSELQTKILSEQLEAVYGRNGYYVAVVGDVGDCEDGRGEGEDEKVKERKGLEEEKKIQYSKIKEPDIISSSKDIGILDNSQEFDTTGENTAWHQIRKGIIEEFGESIDKVWFSKAVAAECQETETLTLTMPTRFMADWVRNNYSHVIRRLSERCGVKSVEYDYE